MTAPDLDAMVDALYAGPPEEFVAARDALARAVAASGDDIGAARVRRLRRPTVAGWAVNQVARTRPDDVAALVALGDELRAATAARDRGRITMLDRLRRERIEALVGPLRESGIGGRPVSADVVDRVGETLTAAVMDADAGEVVLAGRLGQALQHVGFGIVDEGGDEADVATMRAEAPERAGASEKAEVAQTSGVRADDAGAEAAAQAAREAADREVDAAEAEVARLESLRDAASDRAREAGDAVARLSAELERLRAEEARVTAEVSAHDAEVDEARRRADAARQAREALDGPTT